MTKKTNPSDYIVVDDGQYVYPVLRSDLRDGDSEKAIRAMSGEEYGEWCNAVPADLRHGDVGTEDCAMFCDRIINGGAEVWFVA